MLIDGVFSGGGMKGYALAGAITVAEERGFQFHRLAGTSAGAIIASLLAAGYRSDEIITILKNIPRKEMLDGSLASFPLVKWFLLYWKMGLYKGDAFERWLSDVLAAKGIVTFQDLGTKSLRVITSDLTNNALVVIPDDLHKYGIDPATFPVAKAVRMSMSVPYIFQPVKIKKNLFVDGGVLSNFPMWLFEKRERPVLGIKLSPKEKTDEKRSVDNAFEMFSALFDTALNAHDLRYISRKLEKDIIFITLPEKSSLDFEMSDAECELLIRTGEETAKHFFKTWSY